jgi:RNA polymerase sigma factor (sigma-70 family)
MSDKSNYKNIDEERIIRGVLDGSLPNGFNVLYEYYYPLVADKCHSLLHNRELAKDVARDALTKAYEKLPGFKMSSGFGSWLYTLTYNMCIDYLRQRQKLHYPEWNKENDIPEIIDEIEDEEEQTISFETLMMILDNIHPEEKAILLMKYQDDLQIKQICTALRISESAAKMRLKRARQRVMYIYKQKFSSAKGDQLKSSSSKAKHKE